MNIGILLELPTSDLLQKKICLQSWEVLNSCTTVNWDCSTIFKVIPAWLQGILNLVTGYLCLTIVHDQNKIEDGSCNLPYFAAFFHLGNGDFMNQKEYL